MRSSLARVSLLVGALSLSLAPAPGLADEPATPAAAEPSVAVVTGDKVNLRVGPRVDDAPVMQLEQGTVLLVVERAGEWLGVRVPAGFSVAVADSFTQPVDADHVKITGNDVNIRRGPGLEQPVFRDRLQKDMVVPVLAREGTWLWIEAPEDVRAYVNAQYVKEVGPLSANEERVRMGRAARTAREQLRGAGGTRARTESDDAELRKEIGGVSKGLLDARAGGGYDVAPVASLEDRLEAALVAHPQAGPRTKSLARVLIEDLRREAEIRVAYADDILAKKRVGKEAPPFAPAPAPKMDSVEVVGTVRFESAPGSVGDGSHVLYSGDVALYVLRWTSGDLKPYENGTTVVRVKGKTMGGRMLGLPILEVGSVEMLPP